MKGKLKRTLIVLAIAAGIIFVPYWVGSAIAQQKDIFGSWCGGFVITALAVSAIGGIYALFLIASEYIKTGRI